MAEESGKQHKAVVLLSGGADSAATLATAISEGFDVYALTFDYGQRHRVELKCAENVASSMKVSGHRIVRIDLAPLAKSVLTGPGEVPVDRDDFDGDIPPTYVPARNLVFLSIAAAWAESLAAHDIFIGVSCVDYSGYPDCRPEFLESFEKCVNLATRTGTQGEKIHVRAPFLNRTKAEVITAGTRLGVDFALTHSCYDPSPDGRPCLRCDSCRIRAKAFEEAGIQDPRA